MDKPGLLDSIAIIRFDYWFIGWQLPGIILVVLSAIAFAEGRLEGRAFIIGSEKGLGCIAVCRIRFPGNRKGTSVV